MEWFTTDNLKVFEESIRADNPERMCKNERDLSMRPSALVEMTVGVPSAAVEMTIGVPSAAVEMTIGLPSAAVEMTIGVPSAAVEMTRVKLVGMTRGKLLGVTRVKLVGMTKAVNDGDVRWVRPETLRVSFRASKTSREISGISRLKANVFQSK